MSYLDAGLFDAEPELELFSDSYYKLPFCDEDVKDLKNLCSPDDIWDDLDEQLSTESPHSPSSTSSSSGHNQLMNERPDTPLMAVKFEDFSNGYEFNNIPFPSLDEDVEVEPVEVNIDEQMMITDDQESLNVEPAETTTGILRTGSERTIDCSLSSVAAFDKSATFTISKGEDGSATIRPSLFEVKEEVGRECGHIFSRDQPVASTINEPLPQFTATLSKPSQVYVCEQTAFTNGCSAKRVTDHKTTNKPSTSPNPKAKVVPQAKITTNTFTHKTQIQIPTSTLQSILKSGCLVTTLQQQDGKIRIKTEPRDDAKIVKVRRPQSEMPPTPPSTSSSDGEGSLSPRYRRDSPTCHIRVQTPGAQLAAQLLSPAQRFTQSHGPLILTEEERRTLLAEGYSIPSKLPLSKSEEKSLKKVRRKIKNKLSAQESRRKKKEYVETLEKRMDDFNKENMDLKRKVDSLENSNRSLLSQLRSLQTLLAGKMPKPSRSVTTQTSSCLMMLVLCFAFLLGGWHPHLSPWASSPNATPLLHFGYGLEELPSNGKVVLSYEEPDRCYEDENCYGYQDEWPNEEGQDTYDEPAGGRVTMNDTGEKIVRNTMEPITPAEVIASRKVVVKNSKLEVIVGGETPHDVTKKVVMTSQRVTE